MPVRVGSTFEEESKSSKAPPGPNVSTSPNLQSTKASLTDLHIATSSFPFRSPDYHQFYPMAAPLCPRELGKTFL